MSPRIWLNWLGAFLLLTFPTLSLLHRSAPGGALHILAALGLIALISLSSRPDGRTTIREFWGEYWLLCLAMAMPLFVSIVSTGYAGVIHDAFSTPLQRLTLAGFVFFALYQLKPRTLLVFQWGVIVAAFTSSIMLYIASQGGAIRPTVNAHNLLNYTNFIVLLGLYSLYILPWRITRYPTAESLLKILAFISVVYSVFLSGSRGPFLSMAVLLVLYALFGIRAVAFRWRAAGCAALLMLFVLAVLQSTGLQRSLKQTADAVSSSASAVLKGEPPRGGDASTRVRLGLWQASWLMAKEHPWIGDGSRSFSEKLIALNQAGLVNDEVTWRGGGREAFQQPHNEFANAIATRGIAGGIALLLLYGVPMYYFAKRRRSTDTVIRTAADMGMATCAGAVLFGLTVSPFTAGWMAALYVLLIGIFISLSQDTDVAKTLYDEI